MSLRISVDRAVLAQNLTKGEDRGPIAIEYQGDDCCIYARTVFIPGPCTVVYKPADHDDGDALASVWIEVDGDVEAK